MISWLEAIIAGVIAGVIVFFLGKEWKNEWGANGARLIIKFAERLASQASTEALIEQGFPTPIDFYSELIDEVDDGRFITQIAFSLGAVIATLYINIKYMPRRDRSLIGFTLMGLLGLSITFGVINSQSPPSTIDDYPAVENRMFAYTPSAADNSFSLSDRIGELESMAGFGNDTSRSTTVFITNRYGLVRDRYMDGDASTKGPGRYASADAAGDSLVPYSFMSGANQHWLYNDAAGTKDPGRYASADAAGDSLVPYSFMSGANQHWLYNDAAGTKDPGRYASADAAGDSLVPYSFMSGANQHWLYNDAAGTKDPGRYASADAAGDSLVPYSFMSGANQHWLYNDAAGTKDLGRYASDSIALPTNANVTLDKRGYIVIAIIPFLALLLLLCKRNNYIYRYKSSIKMPLLN